MKGQSQIIQFILFFLIGLSIFLAIGNLFSVQLTNFGEEIGESNRRLVTSLVSAHAISQFAECKECDNANITFRIQNKTANFFIDIKLKNGEPDGGINTFTMPGEKMFASSMHKVKSSISILEGSAVSGRPIILSLKKTQNRLVLGNQII